MRAAFFDLDKTVIAKASIAAFGRPFYKGGLINRRLIARSIVSQIIYLHLGASEQKLARVRESMLALTKGWDRERIREIVREALEETVEPIIYAEALDLIEAHRAAGYKVYLVSASPEEIVEPLAEHLGVDGCIATRAVVDDEGRYAGEMEFYAYGPFKAEAMRDAGRGRGPRPGRVLRLLGLLHRPAHARGGRPSRGGQPGPGPGQGRPRARVGGHAVHQAGAAARPDERAEHDGDGHGGRGHRSGHGGRAGGVAPGATRHAPEASPRGDHGCGAGGRLRAGRVSDRRRLPSGG